MDTAARNYPPGDLRVSDADRDRALSELSEHFQAGRLTAEEFDERSGRALEARTGKELGGLLADLPAGRAAAAGVGHCHFSPAELVAGVLAISQRVTTGRWGSLAQADRLDQVASALDLGAAGFTDYHPGPLTGAS